MPANTPTDATDATDDRHPSMIHENINEAFLMLGPFYLV
jgi:hypothetical protein